MATVRSQDVICRIVKDGILELETKVRRPICNGVVMIDGTLLAVDWNARFLWIYNGHDGKLITYHYIRESRPYDICLISKSEFAVCYLNGFVEIVSLKSIFEGKLNVVKWISTGFDICLSLAKWNSDKLIVSGKKDDMLCWGIISILDFWLGFMDSSHDICEGIWTHMAIKGNTVYISCRTGESITRGVYAYDILNPQTKKFLYQHQELERPWSIMADRDYVYVCDYDSNRIHQLTDSGQLVTVHTVSSRLDGILYDDQHGLLYTISWESNVITVYKMESLHQTDNNSKMLQSCMQHKMALAMLNKAYYTEIQFVKPQQLNCLKSLEKHDTVAILPTGYGKSLIFDILPYYSQYVLAKTCIVIIVVPLNSILQQEIQKLKAQVLHIKTGIDFEQTSHISYFIGHPEDVLYHVVKLGTMSKKYDITYLVVDQAHCNLELGEDFRPEFERLSNIRPSIKNCLRVLAVTATASQTAQCDIYRSLGMTRCTILSTTPVLNENISINIWTRIPSTGERYTVEGAYDYVYKPLLLELHRNKQTFPLTIVYCELKWCEYGIELARRLLGSLFLMDWKKSDETACVVQFHSQQPEHVNQEIITKLSQDVTPVRLVFATTDLGMGCDLRHVMRVIHAGPPSSLEAYTQEIGRAGRDGSRTQAILYYNATDLAQRHIDKAMKDFFMSNKCRRLFLSGYFDVNFQPATVQECCDICANCEQFERPTIIPSLEQRNQVVQAIQDYMTGDSTSCFDEHITYLISETFEFCNTAQEIELNFHLPPLVVSAIQSIITHILQ